MWGLKRGLVCLFRGALIQVSNSGPARGASCHVHIMKRLHGVTPNMTIRGKLMNHWVLAPKSDMETWFISPFAVGLLFNLFLQNSVTHGAQLEPQWAELICEAIHICFPGCDDSAGKCILLFFGPILTMNIHFWIQNSTVSQLDHDRSHPSLSLVQVQLGTGLFL